jgi:hypothetical protein
LHDHGQNIAISVLKYKKCACISCKRLVVSKHWNLNSKPAGANRLYLLPPVLKCAVWSCSTLFAIQYEISLKLINGFVQIKRWTYAFKILSMEIVEVSNTLPVLAVCSTFIDYLWIIRFKVTTSLQKFNFPYFCSHLFMKQSIIEHLNKFIEWNN